jgi:hypothetical protein
MLTCGVSSLRVADSLHASAACIALCCNERKYAVQKAHDANLWLRTFSCLTLFELSSRVGAVLHGIACLRGSVLHGCADFVTSATAEEVLAALLYTIPHIHAPLVVMRFFLFCFVLFCFVLGLCPTLSPPSYQESACKVEQLYLV